MNWLLAIGLAVLYAAIDVLWTVYTVAVTNRRPLLAANSGVAIYLAGAAGTIVFVNDWRYIAPIAVGAWLGTLLAVRLGLGQ